MRALTLTQPWAGLVASGIKRIENRTQHMIRRDAVGTVFAVHASREVSKKAMRKILEIAPELGHPHLEWMRLAGTASAVIAVATLETCVVGLPAAATTADGWPRPMAGDIDPYQQRWFTGPIGYLLRDIRPLAEPVPCRGWLGFWRLGDDIARLVEEQIA